MHTADRRCAGTPGLPCAVVLRLMPRSPRRRIPLASVADGLATDRRPGRAPTISISLTPATGARTTRFCRPQLPRAIRLNRPVCCRKKFRPRRLSAGRLRVVPAHGRSALRTPLAPDAAASTATRPNVRDDGQRPSCGTGWRSCKFDLGHALSEKSLSGAK
jgi:hypothetical protein